MLAEKKNFVYASSTMDTLAREAAKLAPYNINLFLCGESGVGKEELAREIHRLSGRPGKFVAINCANLMETLVESELFGYVKGAFTGALQNKRGLLEEANKGTFFLDEIGDLPLNLQAKLLRVIQERCFRPLGATKDVEIDIRFLAASHKNLGQLVEQKLFREDLFYRIQESTLQIPPLRERPEDIEILSHHFVQQFTREFRLASRTLSPEAMDRLVQYGWPGNIRELKNVCRMAVILASGSEITLEQIKLPSGKPALSQLEPAVDNPALPTRESTVHEDPAAVTSAPSEATSSNKKTDSVFWDSVLASMEKSGNLRNIIQDFERNLILSLLDQEDATQVSVAGRLGISVRTLQRVINRSGSESIQAQ